MNEDGVSGIAGSEKRDTLAAAAVARGDGAGPNTTTADDATGRTCGVLAGDSACGDPCSDARVVAPANTPADGDTCIAEADARPGLLRARTAAAGDGAGAEDREEFGEGRLCGGGGGGGA